MRRRPGNPGLKGKLLDASIEAYILALETINRLSIKHRIEAFSYLICNAWELILKAKIIEDSGKTRSIYYPKERGKPLRSISLRDALKKVFPDQNSPVRRNIERVADLRDEAVHLIIAHVPQEVLSVFQACVVNYHEHLVDWFGVSLSDRVPVGMMALVYDLPPERLDLTNARLRRELGKDTVEYLTKYQAELRRDGDSLGGSRQFSIDISYTLALVKKPGAADVVLTSGEGGAVTGIVAVPRDISGDYPYLESDLAARLNELLPHGVHVNWYDVRSVVKIHRVKDNGKFFYRGGARTSPAQYSELFLQWMLDQHRRSPTFFQNARQRYAALNRKPAARPSGG